MPGDERLSYTWTRDEFQDEVQDSPRGRRTIERELEPMPRPGEIHLSTSASDPIRDWSQVDVRSRFKSVNWDMVKTMEDLKLLIRTSLDPSIDSAHEHFPLVRHMANEE